jgi:hypothetical protein
MPHWRQIEYCCPQTTYEESMASPFIATQDLPASRSGLTSLAAETRQIVDRHQEVERRASRKLALAALALVAVLALVLLLLSTAVQG